MNGTTPTAWVDGEFLPLSQARVPVEDRGYLFGDGVYEVIACFDGRFLDLQPHLARLARSAAAIEIALPLPLPELEQLVRELYLRNPYRNATLYLQVTRGVGPRSHQIDPAMAPKLTMFAQQMPQPDAEKLARGVAAITRPDIRWQRCDIKAVSLLAAVLGRLEASRANVDETIWIGETGELREGCASNIFAVIDGVLTTHPADNHILGGIVRDLALRLAGDLGIPAVERPWHLDEPGISECLLTSTGSILLPLTRIDGQTIGDGRPGPIAARLRHAIAAHIEARIEA